IYVDKVGIDMSTSESSRRTFQIRLNKLVNQIREDIMNGNYKRGTYLPPEKTLAKQYQLSNKSVRKGLEQLLEEGLIKKIPRVGSMVIAPNEKVDVILESNQQISVPESTLIFSCYPSDER